MSPPVFCRPAAPALRRRERSSDESPLRWASGSIPNVALGALVPVWLLAAFEALPLP